MDDKKFTPTTFNFTFARAAPGHLRSWDQPPKTFPKQREVALKLLRVPKGRVPKGRFPFLDLLLFPISHFRHC